MRAGTKATCCWLSAVLSQSCCVQTCWLLSAADFTDAIVGHRGVSKGERQSQTIHHYKEAQRNTHRMQRSCKGRSDPVLPLRHQLSLCLFQSICLRVSLALCISHRQTGGHEICSTCIRVNQPTLTLQSTTPLGSQSERLGRRDSCVVDTHKPHQPLILYLAELAGGIPRTHTHTGCTNGGLQSFTRWHSQAHCVSSVHQIKCVTLSSVLIEGNLCFTCQKFLEHRCDWQHL